MVLISEKFALMGGSEFFRIKTNVSITYVAPGTCGEFIWFIPLKVINFLLSWLDHFIKWNITNKIVYFSELSLSDHKIWVTQSRIKIFPAASIIIHRLPSMKEIFTWNFMIWKLHNENNQSILTNELIPNNWSRITSILILSQINYSSRTAFAHHHAQTLFFIPGNN